VTSADRVEGALAVRRWVLGYLGGGAASADPTMLKHTSAEAWSLFLRMECCALPLLARFRADRLFSELVESHRVVLDSAATSEMQRVLAARLILRELDAVCDAARLRIIVLKGGAHAADARLEALDLGDVDVLAREGESNVVWRAMLAHGWGPTNAGVDPSVALGDRIHFAPLQSTRHALRVEVHERFSYGDERTVGGEMQTVPITGTRALDRPVGVNAVLATLAHSVIKHPYRRGHIRDLVLLSAALTSLAPAELSEVRKRVAAHDYALELLDMLEQASAFADRGRHIEDTPRTLAFVTWKYAAGAGTSRIVSASLPGWENLSYLPLERPRIRRAAYRHQLRYAVQRVPLDSPIREMSGLGARVAHSLGLARLARSIYRLTVVGVLIVAAPLLRRHVRWLAERSRR